MINSVTIGTYNVKNLYDKCDVGNTRTPVKSERSKDALAENIRRTNADVVTLQECSSEKTLHNFMESRGLSKMYPHVAYVKGNDQRGINVAIISKYPFTQVTSHASEKFPLADGSGETRFSRDLLRADIDFDGNNVADFTVYTTHLKSRRPSSGPISADTKRLSEGQAVRNIVEREMSQVPGRMFVVTGDFNDGTENASVQAVLHPKNGGEEWVDSLADRPHNQRTTWPANPNASKGFAPEQFDHMIYPKSQAGNVVKSEIHRYGQSDTNDTRWVSSAASDHLMVTTEFKLSDGEQV